MHSVEISRGRSFCLLALATTLAACGTNASQSPVALPPAAAAQYAVIEIPTLGGGYGSPAGIRTDGFVAGQSLPAGSAGVRGFTWRQGAKIEELPTFGGPNAGVWNMTSSGVISGLAETNKRDPNGEDYNGFGTGLMVRPAVWSDGGKIRQLPLLPKGNNGNALGSNDAGEVGGDSEIGKHDPSCKPPQVLGFKPVIWKDGKIEKVLPTWPGDSVGGVIAMNDHGDATGSTGFCSNGLKNVPFDTRHAVLWRKDGKMINLGRLGCPVAQEPLFINNQDQVVGLSNLHGCKTYHAFLWDGKMHDLGAFTGDCCSDATAITSSGAILGQSCTHPGNELGTRGSAKRRTNCRGAIFEGGKIVDFNTLIPADSPVIVEGLNAINGQGMIVGDALDKKTGVHQAFLAIPLK